MFLIKYERYLAALFYIILVVIFVIIEIDRFFKSLERRTERDL